MIIAAIAVAVAAISANRRRKRMEQLHYDPRVCGKCGTSQPSHAAYCRNCGERL
jgi:ribosomal protein L40E